MATRPYDAVPINPSPVPTEAGKRMTYPRVQMSFRVSDPDESCGESCAVSLGLLGTLVRPTRPIGRGRTLVVGQISTTLHEYPKTGRKC